MKQAEYIERRLHPARSMPEYFTLRHLLDKVIEMASVVERSGWAPPIRVLDAGAGCAPYRTLFAKEAFQYFAADRESIAGVSVLADGQQLPFADGSFDLVLSNQVLEHVADPRRVSKELMRMISPRGYLLLSCPFVWEIHNYPGDFWRFTAQALELLFADMELIYLEPSTNSAECLVQTFNLFLNRNFKNEWLKTLLFRLTNSRPWAAAMPASDRLLPANYVLAARKPAPLPDDRQVEDRRGGNPPARTFQNAVFRTHLDLPGTEVSAKRATLQVVGWIAGDCRLDRVFARVDDSPEWEMECNLARPDVWRAFPEHRNAHRCGFTGSCLTGPLSAGEHTLEIIATLGKSKVPWEPIRFIVI